MYATLTKVTLLAFLLVANSNVEATAPSANELRSAGGAAITKLQFTGGLVSLAAGGAIDKANEAARQRLEQLNAIIQSALFNVQGIINESLQELDERARIQRMETIRAAEQLADQVNSYGEGLIDNLDQVLNARQQQLALQLGNLIDSLPLPTIPIVNLGAGLSIIGSIEGPTRLHITGSGLRKGGDPVAVLLEPPSYTKGSKLKLESASMGLLTFTIDAAKLPKSEEPTQYILDLTLSKGGLFSGKSRQSFPVSVCTSLPRYSLDAKVEVTQGAIWERTLTPYHHYHLNCTGQAERYSIVASPPMGYLVDLDASGYRSGMRVLQSSGDNYHSELWAGDAFMLYCASNNGRGSNSWAEVSFAYKRRVDVPICGTSLHSIELKYGKTQFSIPLRDAEAACDPDLKTAQRNINVTVKRGANVVESANLGVPFNGRRLMDGQVTVAVDSHGLVNVQLRPSCRTNTVLLAR